MKKLTLATLLLLSFIAAGQPAKDSSKFGIRLAPLALVDFYNGSSYKAGFEIMITEKLAFTADIGGYFKNFNGFKNYKGHNLDFALRYYSSKSSNGERLYISLNYFYKNQAFDYSDTIQTRKTTTYEVYRTQKFVSAINLNVGLLKLYQNKCTIDVFGGVGVRYKKANSTLTLPDLENGLEYRDSQSLYFLVTPGNYIWPNLNLGLRVGLRV